MKTKPKMEWIFGDLITAACRKSGTGRTENKANHPVGGIKVGLGIALLTTLTGCVGYVDGGYGGTVVVPGPPVLLFGGGYERGHEVHEYSRRGFESRGAAHHFGGWEERRR